jgi:UDP-glucose 4-epimerase
MPTLLFTGGTGYIGSHTAVEFLSAGHDVIILDNLSNSDAQVLDAIKNITGKSPIFYDADIRDREALERIFEKHSIDTVIHFAGLKSVGESCAKPSLYHENNVGGSIVLFETMEKYSIKNIVFSSSATVYSSVNPLPWNEDGILGTTNPYGTTKLIIEYLLRDYALHLGWHVANLRYFNPIGAHSTGIIGENPRGIPNNLLPYVMQVASGQREKVIIHGDDYDTPDGTGIRDYIHVVDLALGHLSAYRYLVDHPNSGYFETWNLGTGKGTSVLEIIRITSEITGKNILYEIWPRRTGDLATVYCDPSRARTMLGWETKKNSERSDRR